METLNKDILIVCLQFCDFPTLIKLRLLNRSTNEIIIKKLSDIDWTTVPYTRLTFYAILHQKRFPYNSQKCTLILRRFINAMGGTRQERIETANKLYFVIGYMRGYLLQNWNFYQTVIEKLFEFMVEDNVTFINHINKITDLVLSSYQHRKITIAAIEKYIQWKERNELLEFMKSEKKGEKLGYVKCISYLYDLKVKIISIPY